MVETEFNPKETALIAIDLQHGIVAMKTTPNDSRDVVTRTRRIAQALRLAGGTVVFVRVANSSDGRDTLEPSTDAAVKASTPRPTNFSDLVPELEVSASDLVITKRQWGAFYGTELELQLRRRGITTLILTGIATNIGVESTARDAFERGFQQVFVDDALAAMSDEAHNVSVKTIFARIGKIRPTDSVVAALSV